MPQGLVEYILVDPASTVKKKSDFTVIERWGVDYQGKSYLLEGVRDKVTAYQRIDLLFEFVSHAKNLKEVKYEVIGGRHGDLEIIEQRKREKGIFFSLKETKSTTSSKTDRIEQRLVGQYHAGMVLLPQELYFISKFDGKVYNFVQLLKLEYLQFPFTEHDDILDTQAQLFEEKISRGTKEAQVVRKEGMTYNDLEKTYAEIDKYKKSYPGLDGSQVQRMISSQKLGRKIRLLVRKP